MPPAARHKSILIGTIDDFSQGQDSPQFDAPPSRIPPAAGAVLKSIDAGAAYPLRGWQCKGSRFPHLACKPKRPMLALVA